MRNIKLSKTIILTSAIALGCVSVTADAFARGGVGGAAAGHAAASGGVAGGHAATRTLTAPASFMLAMDSPWIDRVLAGVWLCDHPRSMPAPRHPSLRDRLGQGLSWLG
jgi:hypothetical protein